VWLAERESVLERELNLHERMERVKKKEEACARLRSERGGKKVNGSTRRRRGNTK
jgi:hypothetical protein